MPDAPQEKEYLEASINASETIDRISKAIVAKDREREALEDKHGITDLKKEIRDLKREMENTAYTMVRLSTAAKQGRMFDE